MVGALLPGSKASAPVARLGSASRMRLRPGLGISFSVFLHSHIIDDRAEPGSQMLPVRRRFHAVLDVNTSPTLQGLPCPHGQQDFTLNDFPVSNGRADLQHMGFKFLPCRNRLYV